MFTDIYVRSLASHASYLFPLAFLLLQCYNNKNKRTMFIHNDLQSSTPPNLIYYSYHFKLKHNNNVQFLFSWYSWYKHKSLVASSLSLKLSQSKMHVCLVWLIYVISFADVEYHTVYIIIINSSGFLNDDDDMKKRAYCGSTKVQKSVMRLRRNSLFRIM